MLIAKAKDPAFWEKVRVSDAYKPMRDELLRLWEENCTKDIPACKYSEFILFNVTGSRKEYEASYFARRRSLNTSALLSLIYPDEEKYLARLIDTIWAILDEYVWVLPAHMPSFTENVVEFIDLFAAETGFALSEIDYLLGDRLPALIRSRIRAEIDRRIIAAYTGERRYWWEKCTNNWAAVCVGSVGATFLYMHPEMVASILPRVQATLSCFLAGFPEDGICVEGFGYWHYGFGFFTCFADLLRDFTNGEIDYFADPKVKQIAKFAQRMFLTGNATVSFSDSGPRGRYHIGLLHYLKNEYPDAVELPPRRFSYTNDSCGRWCLHLRAFLWFDEALRDADPAAESTDYAPAAQWLVRKTAHYGFAAKGGANNESHNHNDLGSFIVAKDGEQLLCDVGGGVYNRAYFSSRRYENFKASSRGHSVPIIAGEYQAPGGEHRASASFEDGVFTVEFSRGYTVPALKKLTRAFAFTEDAILLTDEYEADGELPVVERFVTTTAPEITPDGVKIGGILVQAEMDTVESFAVTHLGDQNEVHCLDYTLKPGARRFALKVQA